MLCASAISIPPISSPRAINVTPKMASQSQFFWSPITKTMKPMATGVTPTTNSAAPGMIAEQTQSIVTKIAISHRVNLNRDGWSDCGIDATSNYRFRQNDGMNNTRIAKISIRPIIISQTNKNFDNELKWP